MSCDNSIARTCLGDVGDLLKHCPTLEVHKQVKSSEISYTCIFNLLVDVA